MTAEVVIMNKVAVAMAADSAVTVRHRDGVKIYNSAEKLFALSHYCPVGLMIYGSAELMGMPWSTIIKLYRDQLGKRKYPALDDYAKDFMDFLQKNAKEFFSEEHQSIYFGATVIDFLQLLKEQAENAIKVLLEAGEQIDSQRDQVMGTIIESFHETLENKEDLQTPTSHVEAMNTKYGDGIQELINRVLNGFSIDKEHIQQIKDMAVWLTSKNFFSDAYTGVVFAGFGEKEYFPAMAAFKVELIVNDYLKYFQDEQHKIAFDNPVVIKAFAQSEIVGMFMEGIHREYNDQLWEYIEAIFESYPESIVNNIPKLFIV